MWEPYRLSIQQHAPNGRIVYDKFHVMQHANHAIDEVRRAEFFRKGGRMRRLVRCYAVAALQEPAFPPAEGTAQNPPGGGMKRQRGAQAMRDQVPPILAARQVRVAPRNFS
jgi:hypothetical protein